MASRPRWRGTLSLGLVSVPVHLYSTADKKSQAPVGHGVHRTCMTQANQKKWCEFCQGEINEAELMRGYDVPLEVLAALTAERAQEADGEPFVPPAPFVELSDEEVGSLKVESTKTIHVTRTADARDLEPLMIAETYYLVSDGTAAAAEAESVLVQALKGKLAVGTLVLSGRERPVAVMVHGETLVLHVLRTADAMKSLPDRVPLPKANPQMVDLAKQLVESMAGSLDLDQTVDRYAEGLKQMVIAKAGGETIELAPPAPAAKVFSLMDALAASVKAKKTDQMNRKIDEDREALKMSFKGGKRKAS